MYKFEDISSFESLLKAHYRARKNKRHKLDVINFEINAFYNLAKIEQDLNNGSYRIRRYKHFMVYDPKEREIQALDYYDRIVQNSLCYNFLVPYYGKKLIYDNSACQKNKGTHFARARFEGFIHKFYKKKWLKRLFFKT